MAKEISKENDPNFRGGNINSWGPALDNALPGLQEKKVLFNDDYEVQPWQNWYHTKTYKNNKVSWKLADKSRNPEWWVLYNNVKHQRTTLCSKERTYFTKANLKNVILSLAALRIVEIAFLEKLIESDKLVSVYNKGKLYS